MIKFYRGLRELYNLSEHGSGIYFATDTCEILHNGKSYSGLLSADKSVKTIELVNGVIVVTYTDNTTTEIEVGSGVYKSNITDKTLTTPNSVGGIDKNTTVSTLEGKTYDELFDDLFFPTVTPTYTNPTASIAFNGYASIQEVGATAPRISNFTGTYSAGEITLNGVKQNDRGGVQDELNSFVYFNNIPSYTTLPTLVVEGNTYYTYRASYNQGPQPKDNKGNDYQTPLSAGYVDSLPIFVNGTYPWFASTVGVSTMDPVAKLNLIAWTTSTMYTGDAGFTLEASGTVPQVIKIPNDRTITVMELYDTGAEKWKTVGLSVWNVSTETININGNSVSYTVYTYVGAARGQVKLRIKF